MKSVLTISEKPKRDLPQMLEEHRAIRDAFDKLADAVRKNRKMEYLKVKLNRQPYLFRLKGSDIA